MTPPELQNAQCPKCGQKMVSRKSRHGIFWGCSQYPKCDGTRDVNGDSPTERFQDKLDREDDRQSER